jgi:hypothetical protein
VISTFPGTAWCAPRSSGLFRHNETLARIGEAKSNNVSDEHDRDAFRVLVVAGERDWFTGSELPDGEGVALRAQILERGEGPPLAASVAGHRPVRPRMRTVEPSRTATTDTECRAAALKSWFVVDPDPEIEESAARLRAGLKLNLADAVQAASALAIGADALVAHDRDFPAVRDLRVLEIRRESPSN